jgi:DNA-directed RNA polymerase subunit F
LQNNIDESVEILKKFAIINGENTPIMNEWGDDFEFTPDFEIKNEEVMDKVVDSIAEAAKKLEEAVIQLTLDLNINPENEDK